MLNRSRKFWPALALTLALPMPLVLPMPAGQDYTCPNCHQTFQFPSNAGSYRDAFIRNHRLVCRSSTVFRPVTPDPALLERIRKLKEEKAIEELKRLVAQAYLDMAKRQMRDEAERLNVRIRQIHSAWSEFARRVDGMFRETYDLQLDFQRERSIAAGLRIRVSRAQTQRESWKRVTERIQARVDTLLAELPGREAAVMDGLEEMRTRGLIAGPAEHLDVPPAPGDGRDADWGVEDPTVQRRTLDSTYEYKQLHIDATPVDWPSRHALAARARRVLPDPRNISISQLLDLRARYEHLKLEVEHDARDLVTEIFAERNAARSKLREIKEKNESMRIAFHVAKRASHVYKGQVVQYYKDLYVGELRKHALNRLEKAIENRVGSRTMALGRSLAADARAELEKLAPYVSMLKRLQAYGDTMHGLGRPSGYMERLFEGIRASTYVHYDPEAAGEAWANLERARSDLGRELQDIGLPQGFNETRRQLEKWFSKE